MNRQIAEILARRNAPEETARELVEVGIAARTGDNATALVVDVIGLPPADRSDLAFAAANLPLIAVPKTGATIDGFHLQAMLADGRYTRVFDAEDRIERRRVILKFPKPVTGAESVLRDAFLREAWIAARVRSPWVGEAIELPAGRRTGLYTALPFYEGETLERRLSRPPGLSLTSGLDYAIKLAGGVAALHRAGIIHRDIKPENVILEAIRPPGARAEADRPRRRTAAAYGGHSCGSRCAGNAELHGAGIVRGRPRRRALGPVRVGVTIYRMFAGAYPYGEIEAFSHPRFKRAKPLAAHRPDLPAWLTRRSPAPLRPIPTTVSATSSNSSSRWSTARSARRRRRPCPAALPAQSAAVLESRVRAARWRWAFRWRCMPTS